MATIYPGAKWRPLAATQPSRMSGHDLIILHTMVGSLWGTDSYFMDNGYGGTESHFGVGGDGEILQWVDLECRADANLDANDNAISIETADMDPEFDDWGGSNVPAWTDAQIEANAQIVAWCCARWNIPCSLIPDSKPGRRGVGYHRQGIDNWRVSGGEYWSNSTGKVCPGDRRVNQVQQVITRAQAILNGEEGDWLDMATQTEYEASQRRVLNEGTGQGQISWAGTSKATLGTVQGLVNQLNATQAALIASMAESEEDIIEAITNVINEAVSGIDDGCMPRGVSTEELAYAIVSVMGAALFGKGAPQGPSTWSGFCLIGRHDLCTKDDCRCPHHKEQEAPDQSPEPPVVLPADQDS